MYTRGRGRPKARALTRQPDPRGSVVRDARTDGVRPRAFVAPLYTSTAMLASVPRCVRGSTVMPTPHRVAWWSRRDFLRLGSTSSPRASPTENGPGLTRRGVAAAAPFARSSSARCPPRPARFETVGSRGSSRLASGGASGCFREPARSGERKSGSAGRPLGIDARVVASDGLVQAARGGEIHCAEEALCRSTVRPPSGRRRVLLSTGVCDGRPAIRRRRLLFRHGRLTD